MKNTVEIKNNKVYKTYASRMDFLREEKIYKSLKGSGLAPELLDSRDGCLEHEYVEGKIFSELIEEAGNDHQELRKLFGRFFRWYAAFRNASKMTLGSIRFDKFMCMEDRMVCLDFENCKPGYIEDDISKAAASMCMLPVPLAEPGVTRAMDFMSSCMEILECNNEMISQLLLKYLKEECGRLNYEPSYKRLIHACTALCCCGVLFAGGKNNLQECSEPLQCLPQRIVSAPADRYGENCEIADFTTVFSSSGINNTLARVVDVQKKASAVWTFFLTTDMPRIPQILMDAFLSADKEEISAVLIEAGGRIREFPLLLNNSKTKVELESALKGGAVSAADVLADMPVRIVKLENIK